MYQFKGLWDFPYVRTGEIFKIHFPGFSATENDNASAFCTSETDRTEGKANIKIVILEITLGLQKVIQKSSQGAYWEKYV